MGTPSRLIAHAVLLSLTLAACSNPGTQPTLTTTPATVTTLAPSTSAPPPPTTEPATPSTTIPAVIASLPDGPCDGIGDAPAFPGAEISFVADGRLYVVAPDGSGLRCALELDGSGPLVWGPAADRLLAGGAAYDQNGPLSVELLDTAAPGWTRPTGKSLVSLSSDGRLVKAEADGGEEIDISFLETHDAVTYYPSGTHVGVIGTHPDDGSFGIWLATNTGADPQLLVSAVEATPSEPAFSEDGLSLYFVAKHDGPEFHVHEVPMLPGQIEFDATIRLQSTRRLSRLSVSPFDVGWVAAQEGVCGEVGGVHYAVEGGNYPDELVNIDTSPVGWLPDRRLVVEAYPDGCENETTDLWIVDFSSPSREAPSGTLLVEDVDDAAIRAPVPPPPPPPDPDFSGFA